MYQTRAKGRSRILRDEKRRAKSAGTSANSARVEFQPFQNLENPNSRKVNVPSNFLCDIDADDAKENINNFSDARENKRRKCVEGKSTNENSQKVRRNWREVKPSEYMQSLLIEKHNHCEVGKIKKSQQKSLFEKINVSYSRKFSAKNHFKIVNSDFNANSILSNEFNSWGGVKSSLVREIKMEVDKTSYMTPKMEAMSLEASPEKHGVPQSFECLPPSSWVFNTPEKQRIHEDLYQEDDGSTPIQPALITTSEETKTLYELREGVISKFDFGGFVKNGEAPVDPRYVRPVSQFPLADTPHGSRPSPIESRNVSDPIEKRSLQPENPFAVCTQRPKKNCKDSKRKLVKKRSIDFTGSDDKLNAIFLCDLNQNMIDCSPIDFLGTSSTSKRSYEVIDFLK